MNVMNRFTLRSMKANRKWTVVTIIGIIISTAMISAVSTFCESFMQLMRNEAIASNGNFHAVVSDVPYASLPSFEGADFVKETSVSRDMGYAVLESSENRDKPYLYVREFDENSYNNYPVRLVEGRMPQNGTELLISEHIKENGGVDYKIGDTLTLDIGERTAPDGHSLNQSNPYQGGADGTGGEELITRQSRTYTVVGIVQRPSFEPTWAPGYTVFTYLDKGSLAESDTVDVSLLVKRLDRGIFDDVLGLAGSAGLDDSHVVFHTELLRYHGITGNDTAQNVIYGFAVVLIVIIMVASVSLIYNAFAISVSERVTQLGMLASVGATKHQKRRSVYFEGFLLGLIGIPAGILFGIAGIGITLSAVRPLLDSFSNFTYSGGLELHVSALSVAAAAALAAVTIFISVWVPARRASGIMPIDAIRQTKEVRLTKGSVKTSRLTRALFGFEGEIALKNLKRSRKKYRATVLSLIISLVLFLTVSYYTEEISRAADAVETGVNFDFALTFSDADSGEEQVHRKISSLEEVGESTYVRTASALFRADKSQLTELTRQLLTPEEEEAKIGVTAVIYCVDDAFLDGYARRVGVDPDELRDADNPKGIFIIHGQWTIGGKRASGKLFDIGRGETLNFKGIPANAELGDGTEPPKASGFALKAAGTTDERPMGASPAGMYIVVSQQVYDALPDDVRDTGPTGDPAGSQIFLNARSPEDVNALETKLQQLTKELPGKTVVFNAAQMAQSEKNVMTVLGIFIYGFIILISLISIANIFNTITTNVALRRREFAMLRSVGMTPDSFNKMLRFESIFYGLKALLYGLPISVGITLILHRLQSDVFEIGFALPWMSYCAAIVLIFIIVGVTMLYSSSTVKKENIIDALKRD